MRHLKYLSRPVPAESKTALPVEYKPGIVGVFQRFWVESKGIMT